MEPENEPSKKLVRPKAISHIAVVHCNYGETDAMVVFYSEGNVDKEISCEKVLCPRALGKGEKRMMYGEEIEVGKGCWISNSIHRTFID